MTTQRALAEGTEPDHVRFLDERWPSVAGHIGDELRTAPTYLIDPDISRVIEGAAGTFPLAAFSRTPPPTPAGFAVFSGLGLEPFPERGWPPVHGIQWDASGTAWAWYDSGEADVPWFPSFPIPVARTSENGHESARDLDVLHHTFCALVAQRIACQSTFRAERAARRRVQRNGSDLSTIQVITLRRLDSASSDDTHGGAVDWTHRWLVGGHWRNHYFPSTDEHRPLWIAPYVKGPQDKPLVVRERVYRWSR